MVAHGAQFAALWEPLPQWSYSGMSYNLSPETLVTSFFLLPDPSAFRKPIGCEHRVSSSNCAVYVWNLAPVNFTTERLPSFFCVCARLPARGMTVLLACKCAHTFPPPGTPSVFGSVKTFVDVVN